MKTNMLKMKASQIGLSQTFTDCYASNFKPEAAKHVIQSLNKEEWPPIYVNKKKEAVRNIDLLLAIQELYPDEEVIVCQYELEELEVWYVVCNANTYGNKTNATRIKEIQALRVHFEKKQGQHPALSNKKKYDSAEEIAQILGVSKSYVTRLEKIHEIMPGLIERIDAADQYGGGAKLSVSGLYETCCQLENHVREIKDQVLRKQLFMEARESQLLPEQLIGIVRQVNQKVKSGVPLADAAQTVLGHGIVPVCAQSLSAESLEKQILDMEVEFYVPEKRVTFSFPESTDIDPETLFEALFPMTEARKYQPKFVRLVEQIYREVYSHAAA